MNKLANHKLTKIAAYSFAIAFLYFSLINVCDAERIKDIAKLQGVRNNQLIGYGLVVGLNGTGDKTNQAAFTAQSFRSMLKKFGVRVPDNMNVQSNNIAAVILTSELPAFAKPGQTIDVTVSSIGNAKSLRGGTLLLTPLRGADGQVYAMSQGNLVTSGLGAEGADGSKITVNVPSVGLIPNGAIVEKPSPTVFSMRELAVYDLNRPDFTTTMHMVAAINKEFEHEIAVPIDASSIRVSLPNNLPSQVAILAQIENLTLSPGEAPAKIIINSRTGTVVIGKHVRIKPSAISHGTLTVTVSEDPSVSQPRPFSAGTTTVVQDTQLQVSEESNRAFVFEPGASLDDLVRVINSVGTSPSDLSAILQSLKGLGAIEGDLVIL